MDCVAIPMLLAADDKDFSESVARLVVLGVIVLGGLLSRVLTKKAEKSPARPAPGPPPTDAVEADQSILLPPLPMPARPGPRAGADAPPAPTTSPRKSRTMRAHPAAALPGDVRSRIRTDRIQSRVASAEGTGIDTVARRSRQSAPTAPAAAASVRRRAFGADRIRSAVTGRDALATAFVVSELLRPPLALRDAEPDEESGR